MAPLRAAEHDATEAREKKTGTAHHPLELPRPAIRQTLGARRLGA